MSRGTRTIDVREREARALRLRQGGLSFAEIGEALGISKTMAHKIVHRALDRIVQEPGEELIALEVARLDALQRAVWTKALGGNLAAVDRALAIAKRRADLLGLDQAIPVEQTYKIQIELVLGLVQRSLLAALPDDGIRYQMALDAAINELRQIATDEVGDTPELEAGP